MTETSAESSFDYIVIGAGSAGCVLANRLSADPKTRVCVIEGGGSADDLRLKVPAGIFLAYCNPKFDHMYEGAPQSEFNGRAICVNRGKAVGGSSSINSMIYIRGAHEDYDEWEALGCKGWSYDDVLPVFKDLERNRIGQDPKYHGFDGELIVENQRDPNIVSKMFVEAANHQQIPENTDFNAESQFGVGIYNVTQDRGERFSSYTAFLKPVQNRKNLTVLTNTTVKKLNFDGARVTGVDVDIDGTAKTIGCRGEVVLSAGAIGSPQILLASGVGPAAELKEAGVAPLFDIPGVGKNLLDHVDGLVTVRSSSPKSLGISFKNLPQVLSAPFAYFLARKGMMTSNYVEAGGFAKTKYSSGLPDIQFHFFPGYRSHRGKVFEFGHGFALHTCVLRPKSVGEITLKPGSDGRGMVIDHKFFTAEEDALTLVEGIKIARSILDDSVFESIHGKEMLPGPDVQSDEEILDYLRRTALTVFHPVGTCKMGTDKAAVTDPSSLKVNGIENLRVADASVMPTLIGGNTNAPSMMVGEKAARMMLAS
ncbi:GMC family oxidoreductase N-terminal domain-containing protein [Methyloligella sp. 2.7D]|uniref:GMC family oxidoreductase n=1 Tax=unclassified Methyloligella TaxID=2625955 RepID=UPI00157C75A6|nr:GMC family oxidoreductase N-terminal domain-containing protein [Methyloligella sp. GL2]QKP76676.1 GMC family oxidoreductase N-terminal domain-containing protein [Methyloligella sp. GL2]